MGTTCLSRQGDREAQKDLGFFFGTACLQGWWIKQTMLQRSTLFRRTNCQFPSEVRIFYLRNGADNSSNKLQWDSHYFQIICRFRLFKASPWGCLFTGSCRPKLGTRKPLLQQWLWALYGERNYPEVGFLMDSDYWKPNASSPFNNTAASNYACTKVRKTRMSSNKKLQSFSREVPHVFPNTSVATTAHLPSQPWPGFSVCGSDQIADRKDETPTYQLDWQRTCPKQNSFSSGFQGRLLWKGFTCRNLNAPAASTGGQRRMTAMRKEKSKERAMQHLRTPSGSSKCSQEEGWKTCPGQGRSSSACCHWGRDTVTEKTQWPGALEKADR